MRGDDGDEKKKNYCPIKKFLRGDGGVKKVFAVSLWLIYVLVFGCVGYFSGVKWKNE